MEVVKYFELVNQVPLKLKIEVLKTIACISASEGKNS